MSSSLYYVAISIMMLNSCGDLGKMRSVNSQVQAHDKLLANDRFWSSF